MRRFSKQWKCLETIAQKHDQIQMVKTTLWRPKQCKDAQNAARMEGGTIGQAHYLLFLCIFHQQALVINCYRMQRTDWFEERTYPLCTLKQEDIENAANADMGSVESLSTSSAINAATVVLPPLLHPFS
jgi:hypothetical protein